MNNHSSCTQLREEVRSVVKLKAEGFSITKTGTVETDCVNFRCNVDGHDWEIRFHPAVHVHGRRYSPVLDLVFLGESRTGVTAVLSGKVIDKCYCYCSDFVPYKEDKTLPTAFHRPMDQSPTLFIGVGLARNYDFCTTHRLKVECTITVLLKEGAAVPSSDLPQHLGELLRSQAGADVTFSVSGESFAAHQRVLAARSPVFMAEFLGETKDSTKLVVIRDMEVAVFKAMLHFIYTDKVPELDEKTAATAFVQDLLVAADRYGLERLRVMCERRLALDMDVSTVVSTLALAEQRKSSRLKAKCIEFIIGGSPENLDAVLASEGYKHLVATCPWLPDDLLKAAHGKVNTCSCKTRKVRLQPTHQLTEAVQSVHELKIHGFCVTKAMVKNSTSCCKNYRCNVDGYDWEIRLYPESCYGEDAYRLVLELIFLGETRTHGGVEAKLRGRLVEYQSCGGLEPDELFNRYRPAPKKFRHLSDQTIDIGKGTARDDAQLLGSTASLTVEFTITVFRDLTAIRAPTSDLHQHLEKLLQSQHGSDVTFTVSGVPFADAHKSILAARSPVFKAEFFGDMEEKTSRCVEIKDMDAQVFEAMLRFIYTDMVPEEIDNKKEASAAMVMAQHLLVAADKYGLDRLKAICERRLSLCINIGTVASTFALAELLNRSQLRAKCFEFIRKASHEDLDAVVATEGYMHLEANSSLALTELLKACMEETGNGNKLGAPLPASQSGSVASSVPSLSRA